MYLFARYAYSCLRISCSSCSVRLSGQRRGKSRFRHSRSILCCVRLYQTWLNISALMEIDDCPPRGTGGTSKDDSFSSMKAFLETKFDSLKRELREEVQNSSDSSFKRFKVRHSHDFKFKGNKKQYEFNVEVLESIDIASDCIRNGEQARSLDQLRIVKNKVEKRNKLIKLADKSAGGWDTVHEYCSDDLASDSEDDKKIRRAESRALAKRKGRKKFTPTATVTSSACYDGQAGDKWAAPDRDQRPFRSFRKSTIQCFACGEWGHMRPECPRVTDSPGASGNFRPHAGYRGRQFDALFVPKQEHIIQQQQSEGGK